MTIETRLSKIEEAERERINAALSAAYGSMTNDEQFAHLSEKLDAVKSQPGYVPGPAFGSVEEAAAALRASLAEPDDRTIAQLRASLAEITQWISEHRAAQMMADEGK